MSAQENGSNNVAIGSFEFGSMGSVPKGGSNNVLIGHNINPSLQAENFVAIGYDINYRSGGGKNGIVIGAESEITYGDSGYTSSSVAPIAIGYKAKSRNAGIAIGEEATIEYGYVAERPSSIAIGKSASATNGGISIGYEASALGSNSIAIGNNACKNVEGRNKICIGANSGPQFGSFNGESYMGEDDYGERIFIGSKSHYNDGNAVLEVHNLDTNDTKIKIPANNDSAVVVNGSLIVYGTIYNTVRRVSSNQARIWGALEYHSSNHNAHWNMEVNDKGNYHPLIDDSWDYYTDSDKRLKFVGTENKSGLDKIRQLKVFNYTFKKDKSKTPRVGVIAQDLQKIFPDAVTKGDSGFLRIRMEDMFYALVNAVKELDAKITELTNQVKILQEQNKYIIKQNKQIMQENKEIKARLKAIEAAR